MDFDGYEGSRGGAGPHRQGGGRPEDGGAEEAALPAESRLPGETRRIFDKNGALYLQWRLPNAALANPACRDAVARAAKISTGLRHDHLRASLEFRDGALWLHDTNDAQQRLEVWLKGFSNGCAMPESAFPVIRHIAEALDYAAGKGAVPQDFGPDSVTILPEGDDGYPAGLLEEFVVADAVRSALAGIGAGARPAAIGAVWRAPELRSGGKAAATAAANQWTLAAILYRMLSGRLPDESSFRPIRLLRSGQNKALRRALSPDPRRRFARCADFVHMAETGAPPGPSRLGASLTAALLVLGIAAAAWYVREVRSSAVDPGALAPIGEDGAELEEVPVKRLSPEAERQLEKALAARKDGRWNDCLAAARAVLGEDPGHAQARELATEAEDERRPWVEIEADRPGAWVAHNGAKVRLPTRIRLEPGGRAGPWDIVADIDGEKWSAFIPEFTVDRDCSGTRKRRVELRRGEVGAGAERKRRTVTLPDGKSLTMIWCPPGTFRMGRRGSGNERAVRLTKGFWLAETELTVGQWKSVRGRSPSSLAKWSNSFKRPPIPDIGERPLENVSWEEASAFMDELNASRCEPGLHFRLPTEAEWEYACRAGTEGDFAGAPEDVAWFEKTAMTARVIDNNTKVTIGERIVPQPPKRKRANAWGFYDMHGNVAEWCADFWTERPWETMPRGSAADDPAVLSGGGRGEGHVVRGGNVRSPAEDCASHARREAAMPSDGQRDGFAGVLDTISKMQGSGDWHYRDIGLRLAADGE